MNTWPVIRRLRHHSVVQTIGDANPSPEHLALYQEVTLNLKRDTVKNALYLVSARVLSPLLELDFVLLLAGFGT